MPTKHTAPSVRAMKAQGRKVVCITAYDVVSGAIADAAGAEVVLVGDSLANVVLGLESTLPVTLEQMEHHVAATRRGVTSALLVADMPFGSYQSSVAQAVDSAVRLMRAGAEAVKLEGPYVDEVRAITRAGIPVMGHVGMTPQSVHAFGGFKVQGRGDEADAVADAACRLEDAGVFALVIELTPCDVAARITASVGVPTIGIGAGSACDGQVQVFQDALGLGDARFRHAKRYAEGRRAFVRALRKYADEVRRGEFPTEDHSF